MHALRFVKRVQALEFIAPVTMMIAAMTKRENEFEPRLGKPPADQAPRVKSVRAVARQVSPRRQSSGKASGSKPRQPSIRAHFAPGSKSRPRPVSATSRRVVVKVRYASNAGGKVAALKSHVAYLSREAAGRAQAAAIAGMSIQLTWLAIRKALPRGRSPSIIRSTPANHVTHHRKTRGQGLGNRSRWQK